MNTMEKKEKRFYIIGIIIMLALATLFCFFAVHYGITMCYIVAATQVALTIFFIVLEKPEE